jgi:hypothetical protein
MNQRRLTEDSFSEFLIRKDSLFSFRCSQSISCV